MRPGVSVNAIKIELLNGDVLDHEGDALLIPSNSQGLMVEGLAGRVRHAIGQDVENEVRAHEPIAVGAALITGAHGKLRVRKLVHSPLMETPGERMTIENVRRCTRAALLAAQHGEIEKLIMPGIGYGENGVPHDEADVALRRS